VLGVDQQPVEPDGGHHLRHQRIADVEQASERGTARAQALLHVIGDHRGAVYTTATGAKSR